MHFTCLALALLVVVSPQDDAPITALARLIGPPPPHYVGQVIDLQVSAVTGVEPPRVTPPRLPQADLTYVDGRSRQVGSSAIGNVVDEKLIHVFRYRLVATRPGPLVVGPFALRTTERQGRTEAIRLAIQPIPSAGRPANFLGGVGPLQVRTEAVPAVLRVGQRIEYRIELIGPAARGSSQAPTLDRLPSWIEVQSLASDVQAEPPRRVLRYQLRPLQAGTLVVPPVRIATFDPGSRRYFTQVGPGVPIRVADVPRFQASTATDLWNGDDRRRMGLAGAIGIGAGLLVLLAAALGWTWRLRMRLQRQPARRQAAQARTRLNGLTGTETSVAARAIMAELTRYLTSAVGRADAAITPREAAALVGGITNNDEAAELAARVVADCDRILFGGAQTPAPLEAAAALLAILARTDVVHPLETPHAAKLTTA